MKARRISDEDAHRLIETVYDAALDQKSWGNSLRCIVDSLHGNGAAFIVRKESSLEPIYGATHLIDPSIWSAYQSYYYQSDVWSEHLQNLAPEMVSSGRALCDSSELRSSEFYNETLLPSDIAKVLAIKTCPSDLYVTLSLYRPRSMPEFGSEELNVFQALLPHIRRAVQINLRIDQSRREIQELEWVLDQATFGIATLRADGRIQYLNKSAQAIVADNDGLTVRESHLAAQCSTDNRKLREAIASAIRLHEGAIESANLDVDLRRPSGKRPYCVTVIPTKLDRRSWAGSVAVAVFITDESSVPALSVNYLRHRYCLTPAEIRLAQAVSTGSSVSEYAEQMDLSRETVRNQLKSVFRKTDTHRQSELVRILLSEMPTGVSAMN